MATPDENASEELSSSVPEILTQNEYENRKIISNTRCSYSSNILSTNATNKKDNSKEVEDVNSNGYECSDLRVTTEDESNNNGSSSFQEVDVPRVLNKSALSKKVFLTRIFPRRPLSLPVKRDSFSVDKVISNYSTKSDVNHNETNLNNALYADSSSAARKEENSSPAKTKRDKRRKTFHQDVEEALNSLLWQPYEYQNKRSFSDSSSFSLSYTSCSSSLSSLDLEEYPNNGTSPEQVGNAASDLHLAEEMVNNLSAGENRLCQWETASQSRGHRGIVAASRLSGTAVGVSRSRSISARVVSACCDEVICDGFGSNRGEMRLEVPPQGSSDGPLAVNNALLSPIRSTSVSNLSSANVVGLPNHPRHASVPSNATLGKSLPGLSYHPRNISEPGPVLPPAQFRFGAQTNANLNHQRHSSHDNTTNTQPNVHLRSASVPKSMVMQKPGESAKIAPRMPSSTEVNAMMGMNDTVHRMAPQTRPSLNVSNVNVNFYRAVPVNVVSAVPTIQCVNSSNDAGNNVSNVHIMPLNGTSQNVPIHVSSSVTLDNVVNSTPSASTSFSTGTTQVAVHTSQVPSYNVQIPTHSVQVPTSANAQVQTPVVPPKKPAAERTRTFTSTEAQTDEIAVCPSASASEDPANKEQRRRERRERRHQRRVNTTNHNHPNETAPNFNCNSNERLPDILNSHLPPPYSPLPGNVPPAAAHTAVVPGGLLPAHHVVPAPPPPGAIVQPLVSNVVPSTIVGNAILPFPPPVVPGQVPLVQGAAPVPVTAASGFRFPFPATGFRRSVFLYRFLYVFV